MSIRLILVCHSIESHSKSSFSNNTILRKLGALKTNARTCSVASSQLSALKNEPGTRLLNPKCSNDTKGLKHESVIATSQNPPVNILLNKFLPLCKLGQEVPVHI
jgi:hypothetical protein